jgi:hypothetical protein
MPYLRQNIRLVGCIAFADTIILGKVRKLVLANLNKNKYSLQEACKPVVKLR